MSTDSSTDIHHEDENYRNEITLSRKALEYLAENPTNKINAYQELSPDTVFAKNYLKAEEGLFDIWNERGGTYGGICAISDMRFLIMVVLKKEKLVTKTGYTYDWQITDDGRAFINDKDNIDKKLVDIWKNFATFYKNFFKIRKKEEFKRFIQEWLSKPDKDEEDTRIRDNVKRVIHDIYYQTFKQESSPKDITDFKDALKHCFKKSFAPRIISYFNKEIEKYNVSGIDLCLKSYYEFNDNFKAALKDLNDAGVINLEEWGKLKIQSKDSEKGKNLKETEEKEDPIQKKIKNLLKANYNLVLTGAPGTGKTYLAKEVAKALVGEKRKETGAPKSPAEQVPPKNPGFCQFHPSFDYTDFVEGLRPVKSEDNQIGFERKDGIFKAFCIEAVKHPEQNYVFIIDEINRGDISKIFGELFYAIDPDYRGKKGIIQTQYSNLIDKGDEFERGFYVPKNVYIIGTMNDIDRSVESMDFAIRRRFLWKKILPENQMEMLDLLDKAPANNAEAIDKDPANNAEPLAKTAKAKMNALNKEISASPELGEDYQIGPAYFLKLRNLKNDFEQLWIMNLEPLLREYLRGRTKEDIDENIKKFKEAYDQTVNNGNTERATD